MSRLYAAVLAAAALAVVAIFAWQMRDPRLSADAPSVRQDRLLEMYREWIDRAETRIADLERRLADLERSAPPDFVLGEPWPDPEIPWDLSDIPALPGVAR